MKKIVVIKFLILLILVGAMFMPTEKQENYEYLRLHIRANSNSSQDQFVKHEVKSTMVEFLTPYLCDIATKKEAVKTIEEMRPLITSKCEKVLRENGFNYSVNIKIDNEFFPTRTYANTTLESGFYDAVIVELGEGKGDNWWCVMYPPLCFVNKNETVSQIKYKSKVYEWIQSIFN